MDQVTSNFIRDRVKQRAGEFQVISELRSMDVPATYLQVRDVINWCIRKGYGDTDQLHFGSGRADVPRGSIYTNSDDTF